MSKVSYASLKLKVNSEVKEVEIEGGKVIEVLQYLPTDDKVSIIESAIQQSDGATVLNTVELEALFHLYIVFKYTNLSFTDKQREDLLKIYDTLDSTGVLSLIFNAIPKTEYEILRSHLDSMVSAYNGYRNSTRAIVEQLSLLAPQKSEELAETVNSIDERKLKTILEMAKSTGAKL